MNKADLVYGVLIGICAALVGSFIFIELATPYRFIEGMQIMKTKGQMGKIITLGATLNLIVFFLLLHYKKEMMARGVVLATIILTVFTLIA